MNYHSKIETWLIDVIIGLNLCPFAKDPFERGKIKIEISPIISEEDIWEKTLEQIEFLEKNLNLSTTLLAFPKSPISFYDLYDLTSNLEHMLENKDIPYQIVAFHPEFKFEDTSKDDPINFVNRSPYPLIHILRSSEMNEVIKNKNIGKIINQTNEKTLNSLSNKDKQKLLSILNDS